MLQDTGRELDKLCGFLGLSPSAEEKERITGGVQFNSMKKNDMTNYSTHSRMDFRSGPFMRKGSVDDQLNVLCSELKHLTGSVVLQGKSGTGKTT